jgi:hypothetical protein
MICSPGKISTVLRFFYYKNNLFHKGLIYYKSTKIRNRINISVNLFAFTVNLFGIQLCRSGAGGRTSVKKSSNFQYPRERPSKIDFRKRRLLEGPSPWVNAIWHCKEKREKVKVLWHFC